MGRAVRRIPIAWEGKVVDKEAIWKDILILPPEATVADLAFDLKEVPLPHDVQQKHTVLFEITPSSSVRVKAEDSDSEFPSIWPPPLTFYWTSALGALLLVAYEIPWRWDVWAASPPDAILPTPEVSTWGAFTEWCRQHPDADWSEGYFSDPPPAGPYISIGRFTYFFLSSRRLPDDPVRMIEYSPMEHPLKDVKFC